MTLLYAIHNYSGDDPVDLFVTDEGDLVLQGKIFQVKITAPDIFIHHLLDDLSSMLSLLEREECMGPWEGGSGSAEMQKCREKIEWRKQYAHLGIRPQK